jgi:hypothetical protein
MKCPEYHELLQQRLDGKPVGETGDLERHLAECGQCRDLHAAARRLEGGLRVLPYPDASPDLTDRIVAAVLRDRRAHLQFRRRLLVVASLAASLLLAVAVYGWIRSRANQPAVVTKAPAPVAQSPQSPGQPGPAPAAVSLNQSMEDAGSAVVSLTRRTAGETVGQTRMLLPDQVPAPPLVGTNALPRDLVEGPPAQSLQEAGHGVSSGLEPMTTSARRAVNLFLRELPPMEPEQKHGL